MTVSKLISSYPRAFVFRKGEYYGCNLIATCTVLSIGDGSYIGITRLWSQLGSNAVFLSLKEALYEMHRPLWFVIVIKLLWPRVSLH